MESRFQDADTFRRVTGHASSTPSSQCSSHRTALPGGVRPSGADTETSPLVATWREAEGHGTLGRPQEKKAQAAGCAERDVRIKVCQLQNGAWRGHRGVGSLLPPPPASALAPAQHPALPHPSDPRGWRAGAGRGRPPWHDSCGPRAARLCVPFRNTACVLGSGRGQLHTASGDAMDSVLTSPPPEGREMAMSSPRSRHPGPRMETVPRAPYSQ